ncbi:hypothetical protein ACET3Z_005645 [Daucus carota]
MDLANYSESSTVPCNCFKVAGLTETILESTQVSNFKDRYVLGEHLGLGQFGIIRACSDELTGEVLACKSISKERLVTAEDLRSVKLEIEIMTKLSGHPNVVELKAVYEEEDYVHLVMELCAGGELFHRLEKQMKFSESQARILFKHLLQVVMYCHDNGIVHRDLKPENILLATKSSSSPIKLADFGLATYIRPGQYLYGTVGSPFYIAPEVLAGGYNQAADVWSAGVILYILLSGVPPFWGKTKSKIFDAVRAADLRFSSDIWDHISVCAKDLISGMLCVDPSKRLTAKQVLAHSWLKDPVHSSGEQLKQLNLNFGQSEAITSCLSNPQLAMNEDYYCSDVSPAVIDTNLSLEISPVFTCKSSFSSFLVDQRTPCSISGGFSFSSSYEPNIPDFSSPIPSMPSFTFFSPCSTVQQSNNSLAREGKLPTSDKDPGVPKFLLPDLEDELGVVELRTERQRGEWKSEPMPTSIRSKRNHTIGLGELDPIDLIVTESVIRWASCTNIVGSSSLRSSLVC